MRLHVDDSPNPFEIWAGSLSFFSLGLYFPIRKTDETTPKPLKYQAAYLFLLSRSPVHFWEYHPAKLLLKVFNLPWLICYFWHRTQTLPNSSCNEFFSEEVFLRWAIQPILITTCSSCHIPRARNLKGIRLSNNQRRQCREPKCECFKSCD